MDHRHVGRRPQPTLTVNLPVGRLPLFFLWWSGLALPFVWPFGANAAKKMKGLFLADQFLINGILLPKLFRPTVRKKCFTDGEKLMQKN